MPFTPEFVNNELKEIVLVSNHSLSTAEAVRLSIAYNQARITSGLQHMPKEQWKVRIVYDIRGQRIPEDRLRDVTDGLSSYANVDFKR